MKYIYNICIFEQISSLSGLILQLLVYLRDQKKKKKENDSFIPIVVLCKLRLFHNLAKDYGN